MPQCLVRSQCEWIVHTYGKDCTFYDKDGNVIRTMKGSITEEDLHNKCSHTGVFMFSQRVYDQSIGGTLTCENETYQIVDIKGTGPDHRSHMFIFCNKI